ncbi:hypothetical protein J6590_028176 [Homalodisca vitripennis]|nr:hypothetical protein J6590_028176 [Homalodisca vitripennis]
MLNNYMPAPVNTIAFIDLVITTLVRYRRDATDGLTAVYCSSSVSEYNAVRVQELVVTS